MSTMHMSSGLRLPLEMSDGVQRMRSSLRRYEWLPSLPAQNPFSQILRPISAICSRSLNSGIRGAPFLFPFAPYAMVGLSNFVCYLSVIQDRRVVRVERDALLRVKRHRRLAAFGEGDQVAVVSTEVVVDDERLVRLARLAREGEAILHLDDDEPPADERVVRAAQCHPTDDAPYPHDASSFSCSFTSSLSSLRPRAN